MLFIAKMRKVSLAIIGGAIIFQALFSPIAWAEASKSADTVDKEPKDKITFVHYRNGQTAISGNSKGATTACFTYIAGGAKWRALKDYIINPTNSNLENTFVQSAIDSGVAEWEKYGGSNIFGGSSINPNFSYIGPNNDSTNVVTFGSWSDVNAVAITTLWGNFSGPTRNREITEWDILFNTYYPWGDAAVLGNAVMDLQDIATHELGHAAGLGDVTNSACATDTMYAYSYFGETQDRTLDSGDIQGITKLYR